MPVRNLAVFLLCLVTQGRGESSTLALSTFSLQSKGTAMGTYLPPVNTHSPGNVSAMHPSGTRCAFTEKADVYFPCLSKVHHGQGYKGEKGANDSPAHKYWRALTEIVEVNPQCF